MSVSPEKSIRSPELTCANTYAHENTPEENPTVDVPCVLRRSTIFCELKPIRALEHSHGARDDDHELDAIK